MIMPSAILDLFVQKLAADAAVEAYCQTNFSKSLKIFSGFDSRNPPGEADAPFAVLHPGGALEGDERAEFEYTTTVDWAIVEDTITTTGNVAKLDGITKVDELGRLILDCLREASPNVSLSSWQYVLAPSEFFPMFLASWEINLNVPHLIGGEVTL